MKLHLHSVIMSCCCLHVVRNWLHVQLLNFNGRHHGYLHICDVLLHPAVYAQQLFIQHLTYLLNNSDHLYCAVVQLVQAGFTCSLNFCAAAKFLLCLQVPWWSLVLFVQGRPRKHHQIRILKFHSKTSVINDPPFIASATCTFMRLHQRVCLCLCLYLLVLLS